MAGEEVGVKALPSVHDGGDCEVLLDECSTIRTHRLALMGRHGHDLHHGIAQCRDVADGDDEAGLTWDRGFAGAIGVGSDDWQASGCGFERADRQAFPQRGKNEGVGGGEQGLHIALEADKIDAVFNAELAGKVA